LEDLRADSVLHLDATVSYPTTVVHFLYGAEDCTAAVPVGLVYAAQVGPMSGIDFVPNTGHLMPGTPEGRQAILDVLLANT
jgi:hypothetical protein